MISIGFGRAGTALARRAPRGARCRKHHGGGLRRARGRRDAVAGRDRGADRGCRHRRAAKQVPQPRRQAPWPPVRHAERTRSS